MLSWLVFLTVVTPDSCFSCATVVCEQQFNGTDDTVTVEIVDTDILGDDVTADIFSNTGRVKVAEVTVSPSSGPVGTEHTIVVEVLDDFEAQIYSVSVDTESEDRGTESFELVQDSADLGLWILTMTSSGVVGEVRTDTFTVGLFEEVEEPVATDTTTQ